MSAPTKRQKNGTGKPLRGRKGLEKAKQLVKRGWVVVAVTDMPSEEVRGYWIYERALSEFSSLIGDNLSDKRHLVLDYGESLIEGLELFSVLDRYADSKGYLVFGPGKGNRHSQMRHYRMPNFENAHIRQH